MFDGSVKGEARFLLAKQFATFVGDHREEVCTTFYIKSF